MKRRALSLRPLPALFLIASLALPSQSAHALRAQAVGQSAGLEELAGALTAAHAGLEEGSGGEQRQARRVAANEVSRRFQQAVSDALEKGQVSSQETGGRGIILDARLGEGVPTVAAALGKLGIPVVVFGPGSITKCNT